MHRLVPATLLALAILAGCAPAGSVELRSVTQAPANTGVAAAPSAASVPPTPAPISPTPAVTTTPAPTARTPEPQAEPAPSARPDRAPRERPFAVNLASAADFVPQYTFEWCVGASIQMARSIITGDRNETRSSQRRLWELARKHTVGSPYGGANPAGWAAALNDLNLGPYRLVSLPTFDEAVNRAARALVQTRRPVGLVMWAGRHAWVMTGFTATANPSQVPDARITLVRVMDPLYPRGSRWGRSPAPNRLIRLQTLEHQFVRRDRPEYDFGVDPGWLLVLPVA